MQKFIDNVNGVIAQLETGSPEAGGTDDKFLEGYMATADNVLEIAAFSMKDPVTGLSNRYGFDNRMILEWNRAIRDKTALSLVIFSVDSIKMCEDIEKCDKLLKVITETLDSSIKRTTDFIARWSDDEIVALLPITDIDGATIVAERIYNELGGKSLPGMDEKGIGFYRRRSL
jgi:diguanylate cyclase (GGDEF)-like protein